MFFVCCRHSAAITTKNDTIFCGLNELQYFLWYFTESSVGSSVLHSIGAIAAIIYKSIACCCSCYHRQEIIRLSCIWHSIYPVFCVVSPH